MTASRLSWWPLLLAANLLACRSDPKAPEYWSKALHSANRSQDKVRLLDDLRRSEYLTPALVPMLHEEFTSQKSPEVRVAVVRTLAQLKDASSVPLLMEAVDPSGSHTLNREIARALGELGDAKAVGPLLRLLGTSDPFVQLQAIESLGRLHSKEAVAPLLTLAQEDGKEPLLATRAIAALGDIADPTTVPILVRLMFEQRGPTPLYDSAAFALYRIGKPAADALLPVLAGTDEKLASWAKQHDVAVAALYSKSAQVLGQMLESRAEPLLLKRLSFASEDAAQQAYVRLTSADALGRLRSVAAVKPLSAMLGEEDDLVRSGYLRALGRIGAKETVPALLPLLKVGTWERRAQVVDALGMLGSGPEVASLEAASSGEPAKVTEECADPDNSDPRLCKAPEELAKKRLQFYADKIAALKMGDKCKDQTSCWSEALADAQAAVRARAALTLGRGGQSSAVTPLLKGVSDSDRETRVAFLEALDWLTQAGGEALQTAKAALPNLEAQFKSDEGKSDWLEATDHLKRFIAKLKRS